VLDAQEPWEAIPPEYYDFLALFLEEGSRQLPPKCPGIDYEINHKSDFQPLFRPLYGLSQAELKAQKEWSDDNLEKGIILPLSCPAASAMQFVKKKEVH
jgi:hypothetical protein